MRLHDFILTKREHIMTEWETFARSAAPAGATMGVEALRDHASEMLSAIAEDLKTSQDTFAQAEKSKGRAPSTGGGSSTAAEEHGADRAESGFTISEMAAEYRALRASVIRLWTREQGELTATDIEDLTRFNEAIDQALAESVAEFNERVQNAKEMFLAILGHDLRNPIGAIVTAATFMVETGDLEEPHHTLALRIVNSATRTVEMVGDLLDFTRSRLGGGIPVERAEISLGKMVHDVVDEVSTARPDQVIRVDTREEQLGEWDEARLTQAFTNLVVNAVEHGSVESPVSVDVWGNADSVAVVIHNRGAVIPEDKLNGIFNPMKSREVPIKESAAGPTGNLGLGLYIAERIVHAHGGRIDVESSEEHGTTFTVHLPRRYKPANGDHQSAVAD